MEGWSSGLGIRASLKAAASRVGEEIVKAHEAADEAAKAALGDDLVAAVESHEPLIPPQAAIDSYDLACGHSSKGLKEEALLELERAVSLGFNDETHMTSDPDLQAIREEPRFRGLVEQVTKQAAVEREEKGSNSSVVGLAGTGDMPPTRPRKGSFGEDFLGSVVHSLREVRASATAPLKKPVIEMPQHDSISVPY